MLLASCSAGNFTYESELFNISGHFTLSLEVEHSGRQIDFHVLLLNPRSVNKVCSPKKNRLSVLRLETAHFFAAKG